MKNFRSFRKVGLMLVAVLATTGITTVSVSAQEHLAAAPSQAFSAVCLSDSQIDNFGRVANGITRGAQPSDKALTQMAKDGVKTIIDLRMNGSGTESEAALTQKLGMNYVHIPMTLLTPNSQQVAQFLNVVKKQENLPVFVHCRQGADRTGTLVAIYRRTVQGWDFDKTYAEMREHHFKPFLIGMKDLVKNCREQKFGTQTVADSTSPNVVPQAKSTEQVVAKLHPVNDKAMAGELQPLGTLMMTADQ